MHKCLGCMEEYKDEYNICPYCGYEQNTPPLEPYHMMPGIKLHNRYIIGKVMGFGGFGVTYIGYDNLLDRKVAIKEYLPGEFSTRIPGTTEIVTYEGERTEQFQKGLEKFVDEAKMLAKMQANNGIVQIYDSFLENSTAYIVMEYMEGIELAQYMKNKGRLTVEEAKEILHPILLALKDVHEMGIMHRDIAPNNIFLLNDGRVKLYDFGASRYISSSHSKSLSVIVKPGYAPAEQYSSRGSQGPWTDVYSLAATFYSMITGLVPEDAMDRIEKEELKKPSKLGVKIKKSTENALMNALNIKAEDRTQNVEILEKELFRDTKVKLHFVRLKKADVGKWPLWAKLSVSAGILAVLVFAGLLATGVIDYTYILPESFVVPEGKARVPNLVNSDLDKAEKNMVAAGLILQIVDKQHSEYIPAGKVLSQNVRKGKIIDEMEVVEVVVSAGREIIYMVDIIGLPRDEALDKLVALGLTVEITEEYSAYAEGVVMAQSVESGMEVYRGDQIIVTVSKGADTYMDTSKKLELPDLLGMTMDEALVVAQRYGFYLNNSGTITARGKGGTIAAQSPKPGSEISQGATINLTMYVEPVVIRMPDVQYKDGTQSVETLKNLGLKVSTVYQESETVAQGKVISQSVAPNTEIQTGDTVTLVISKGGKVVYTWSEWVTELPAGVNESNYEIDTKQQYRFRDKTTMTSQNSSEDGWTQYDMKVEKGEYGDTVYTGTTKPAEIPGVREITSTVQYRYKHKKSDPEPWIDNPNRDGWEVERTERYLKDDWGQWSSPSTTRQSVSDVKQENVLTWYKYRTKVGENVSVWESASPPEKQGYYVDKIEGPVEDTSKKKVTQVIENPNLPSPEVTAKGVRKVTNYWTTQENYIDYSSPTYNYSKYIIYDSRIPYGAALSWVDYGCEDIAAQYGVYKTADKKETSSSTPFTKGNGYDSAYDGSYIQNYFDTNGKEWFNETITYPTKTRTIEHWEVTYIPYKYTYYCWKPSAYSEPVATVPNNVYDSIEVKVYQYSTRPEHTKYYFYRWEEEQTWGPKQTETATCKEVAQQTTYSYRDKQDLYIYYYYRWGSWSDWRDEETAASSNRQVEPRTLYRYKQKG